MKQAPQPPRLARWILERALPSDVRDHVSGDVDELFRRRANSDGAVRSRLWYWRQAITFTARFCTERLHEQRRHRSAGTGISRMDVKLSCCRSSP